MRSRPTALLATAALAVGLTACDSPNALREVPEGEETTIEAPDAPATEVELPDESGPEDGVPDDGNQFGTDDGEE